VRFSLRTCFDINFDHVLPGGPRFVVAAVMKQTDAPKRVPPILKHAISQNRAVAVGVGRSLPPGAPLWIRLSLLLLILPLAAQAEPHELAASLTLDSLIETARHDNAVLRAARAKTAAMNERPAQEKALPNPMFKYGAMDSTRGNLADAGEKRFMVEQPFLWSGKRDLRMKIAGQDAAAMRQEAEMLEREIVMQVKETYYDLYSIQHVTQIVRAEEKLLRDVLTAAENQYATGQRTQQDVIKAEAEITMLQQKLVEQEQQESTLKARLNQLLNRNSAEPLGLAIVGPPRHPSNPAATGERPEIRAAKIDLERSQLQRQLMHKEFFTDYRIGAEYRNYRAGDDMVMLTFSFDLPIWQSKYRAGVREAEKMVESSTATLDAVRQQAAFESADAHYKLRAAQRSLEIYEQTLIPQAESRFKASDASYRTGKGDFMDLLESERFLLNARTMAAMAEGNLGMQQARLERTLGTNLEEKK